MPIPDAATLWIFAVACAAVYISPGPDTLYIASRVAAARDRGPVRAGLWSGLGICLGVQVHLAATVLGLAALIVKWPILLTIVQWAGAAYLAYLGICILLSSQPPGLSKSDQARPVPIGRLVRDGMLVNLLNPKMPAFFLAFLPQFVEPTAGSAALQLLFFGGLFSLGGLVWTAVQAIGFGTVGGLIARGRTSQRIVNWLSGTVLLGLAANLALQQR